MRFILGLASNLILLGIFLAAIGFAPWEFGFWVKQ